MLNRRGTQPLMAFLEEVIAGQALQMEALLSATDANDRFPHPHQRAPRLRLPPAVRHTTSPPFTTPPGPDTL